MCPLCDSNDLHPYFDDKKRGCNYWLCNNCDLIFMDSKHHLSETSEHRRYDEHNNTLEDPRYLNFVSTLSDITKPYVTKGQKGLDFGCGVAAPLAYLLKDEYEMDKYDPFYFPKQELTKSYYDFVLACEVVEHLRQPKESYQLLGDLLKPGGILAIKSDWHKQDRSFETWFYRNDDTHICFYSHKTLHYIARQHQWEILELTDREAVFKT